MTTVNNPFPYFPEAGTNGYIYIGAVNQNAQSNPITVYRDAALTIPWQQPIRTLNGYPAYLGAKAEIHTGVYSWSILIKDNQQRVVSQDTSATTLTTDSSLVKFIQAGTGAVERTVQAKLRDTVSVKDFGAVGDGVTDDAAAIQLAVNAATANQTVYFPAGTYAVGAAGIAITNKTGVTLTGDGAIIKITAISALTTALGAATIHLSGCTRSGVRGLEINGNSIASSAIGLTGCTDCFVDGCTIYSSGVNGQITSAGGGVRNRFTNNLVYFGRGTSRGMWLGNNNASDMETDIAILNNVVRNNPATGIVASSVGGRVVGNHSHTNDGSGIIFPGANGYSAKNLTVTGNYCINNLFHGMQSDVLYSTDADCISGINISGNVCSNNARGTGTGIYMLNTRNCTIQGNTCLDNVSAGIAADDNNLGLTISGNICADTRSGTSRTQQIGIRMNVTNYNSSGYSVNGNTLRNNKNTGLQSICTASGKTITGVAISGNNIVSNANYGIFVSEVTAGDMSGVVIAGNTVKGHATFDLRGFVPKLVMLANDYDTEDGLSTYNFTNGDTTPSVASRKYWLAANSSPTTITAFDDGVNGQEIVIRATNGNTTIAQGGLIVNKGSLNVTIPGNGIISYVRQGTVWFEVFRSF